MNVERFELALERLPGASWQRFERLASEFLAAEFPNLRTVASPSGDGGRDALLFQEADDPSVLVQYSLEKDWRGKIIKTLKRLGETFPKTKVLIYVTNQLIGAQADDLRDEVRRDYRVFLDVRDRSWFLERVNLDSGREAAGEALAVEVVDVLLTQKNIISTKARALTDVESRAACVYLKLQWEDDSREKGLTKVCFEALVRSVLRETDSERRLTQAEIRSRIRKILPSHPAATLDVYIDSALKRLDKSAVRHWRKDDTYCASHEERTRTRESLVKLEAADLELSQALEGHVRWVAAHLGVELPADVEQIGTRVRRVVEKYLFSRGEIFASAVAHDRTDLTPVQGLRDAVIADIGSVADEIGVDSAIADLGGDLVALVEGATLALLGDESRVVKTYLHGIADSYTLFAFLRETPDVQRAVVKMFSHGELWLDTTVLLPLFAEVLLPDERRLYTQLYAAAIDAGLKLHVTEGVLEEIERHLNRARFFARRNKQSPAWVGRPPYVFTAYALAGRNRNEFASWTENFAGRARPVDDIAEYLEVTHRIDVVSLEDEAASASLELRGAVQEVWSAVHERRRSGGQHFEADPLAILKLVGHDVENYVGVIMRRKREKRSVFGYSSWWLTLDSTAFFAHRSLRESLGTDAPDSPAMSPDFMLNYLALGPIRSRVPRTREATLPLIPSELGYDAVPEELLDVADKIREELDGLPELVIQRTIRDTLDNARRRVGPVGSAGTTVTLEEIRLVVARALETAALN